MAFRIIDYDFGVPDEQLIFSKLGGPFSFRKKV